ncbi:MAG: phasin family protein [Acidobacteriota bacterium]|nr:phasin family protein [Acidobacteriota bacterium]
MAKNKLNVDKLQTEVLESARKVWLAGLGAVSTVEEGTTKLFDQLVEQGREASTRGKKEADKVRARVEGEFDKARSRVEGEYTKARSRVQDTLDEAGGRFDQQVANALHRLGIPTRSEIQTLTQRVEELTKQVELWSGAATPAASRVVYHVSTEADGWKVQAEGAETPVVIKDTKGEAVDAARELAKSQEPSQVVVHKMDGTIQHSYSYGDTSN